nr:ribonuclease H-like domain, reverse transcriptase, RNA-dependent DNA polymerase [Tanacetum cinerariifolium]
MTRSSNQDLIQPFENPKRVFQSSRKLFKTQSLDYLSSPEFSLISDLEDQFKEEETKTMKGPTMEEQILDSKGVIPSMKAADPKKAIQDMADHSQKWHNGTSTREIKKVNEKVYVGQVGCELCKGPYYTKDCSLKEEGKILKEAYYTQFGVPFTQGGQYRAATSKFYQRNNGNPSYQKRRQSMEESLNKFMAKSAKRHEENSNLIKEIQASTDDAIRNQGASIKALEIQIGQMSKNNKLFSMPNQVTIPFPSRLYDDCCDEEDGSYGLKNLDVYSIGTTLLNDALPIKEKDPGSITLPCIINNLCFNNALADIGASFRAMPFSTYTKRGLDFIVLDMPEDIKTPLILGRPFFSTAHAKINVFKRKIFLRVWIDKIVFESDKPTSNKIKRVYALSLRERMELDLEARIVGEDLIFNRSLDPLYGDYIELNDLNEPLELRRNQVDDLEPTTEEGEVVDEPMMNIVKTRCDNEIIDGLDEYPSYCDFDRKTHIDCAYNLKFSCTIGYEYVNDFAVVENMDSYCDKGMADIIVGRPFCKDACIKARRFDEMITFTRGTIVILVTKHQNKTPYELLTGKIPLGKGPTWLFDLDYLTDSMNYKHITTENKANHTAGPKETNNSAGTQDDFDVRNSDMEDNHAQEYYVLLLWSFYTSIVKRSKAKNGDEKLNKNTDSNTNEESVDKKDQAFLEKLKRLKRQETEATDAAETLRKTYRRGLINKTLFIKKDKKDIMLVQVYVDDIIFGSTKKSWCDEFEALMKNRFQMSSMGELTFFLGLQVKQKEHGIFISQDKYVVQILKKFDFLSVKTASTPIETKKPLVKDE